jgi:hypothetical protein
MGERIEQENPQRCLICDHVVSVAHDWPSCQACKFDQTSPEAYTIRRSRGLLWRSAITVFSPDEVQIQIRKEQQQYERNQCHPRNPKDQ